MNCPLFNAYIEPLESDEFCLIKWRDAHDPEITLEEFLKRVVYLENYNDNKYKFVQFMGTDGVALFRKVAT